MYNGLVIIYSHSPKSQIYLVELIPVFGQHHQRPSIKNNLQGWANYFNNLLPYNHPTVDFRAFTPIRFIENVSFLGL